MTEDGSIDWVSHPPHYNQHPSGIETIEVTRLCSFDLGNAIKYIWRYSDKNGDEDLKKARFYLRDLLATGQCRYLPAKAKKLMVQVIAADTNLDRRNMFTYLLEGQPAATISYINAMVCPVK